MLQEIIETIPREFVKSTPTGFQGFTAPAGLRSQPSLFNVYPDTNANKSNTAGFLLYSAVQWVRLLSTTNCTEDCPDSHYVQSKDSACTLYTNQSKHYRQFQPLIFNMREKQYNILLGKNYHSGKCMYSRAFLKSSGY